MRVVKGITSIIIYCTATCANAHSGGTDENGCHSGSQPYHCHSSSDESSDESLRIRDISLAITASLSVLSVATGFQDPIYISVSGDSYGGGFGSSYFDETTGLYINSKTFQESSLFNFGLFRSNVFNTKFEAYTGIGVHVYELDEHDENVDHDHDDINEDSEVNFNIGLRREIYEVGLYADLDTGPKSLSLGVSLPF